MKEKIEKENVREIISLSTVQMGMLFHYLKETANNLYNVQLSVIIEGELDVDLLNKAFAQVQAGNEVLRSVFRWQEVDKPVQVILKSCPYEFTFLDVSKDEHIGGFVQDFLREDQCKRFDLSGVPLRLSLIKTSVNSFVFTITHHHILYDGWSTGLLLDELFHCYRKLREGHAPDLVIKPAYKEVRQAIQKKIGSAGSEAYWKEYLNGYEPVFFAAANITGRQTDIQKIQATTSYDRIEAFAREYKVTKAAIVYAAYGILLQKYNNVQDIVFGTTISNRDASIKDYDKVMGNFINTIPLRITDAEEISLGQVVANVNNDLVKRNEFHSTPYSDIKQWMNVKTADDLFDSGVVIENYPLDEEAINSSSEINIKLRSVYENTGIPLLVTVFFRESLEIELAYDANNFSMNAAASLANNFVAVIDAIVADNS